MDMKLLNDAGFNMDDHVLKLATAIGGVVGDVLVSWGMPEGKAGPLVTAITLITGLLIMGISHVQANKLKAQGAIAAAEKTPTATPAVQFNTDSTVSNQPTTNAAPVAKPNPFTPDQLDFIYSQIRQRAQRAKPAPPPAPPAPAVEIHRI